MELPNGDTFLSMLKNQEQVIKAILSDIDTSQKNAKSFEKLESLYKDGKKVNIDAAMNACAKSLRHSNEVNQRLLMLLLVYVSGGNYSRDTVAVMNKFDMGNEGLQEMLKQKLNGL